MKETLIIVTLSIISTSIFGQQIDQSWFLRSDVKFTQVHTSDPDPSYFDVNVFGVDQLWDFSNEPFNNLIDTSWFLDPAEMVFGDQYPDATVGRRNVTPFYDWEWYYRVTEDTIFDMGTAYIRHVGSNLDTTVLTYGPDISVPIMVSRFGMTDSLYNGGVTPSEFVTFQGHGTVITSVTDTFHNCVMLKYESTFSNDFRYVWYQNDLTREIVSYVPPESGSPQTSLDRLVDYWDLSLPSSVKTGPQTIDNIYFSMQDGILKVSGDQRAGPFHLNIYTINGELLYSDKLIMDQPEVFLEYELGYTIQPIIIYLVDQSSHSFLCKKLIR